MYVGEDVEKKKPSHTTGGTANWYSHYGRQYGGSSKKLRIDLPQYLAIPLLGFYPKDLKIYLKDICTLMFIALFMVARIWKQPKCPMIDDWIKKLWYIYTMEHYSDIRRDEILSFATMWMDLEIIMLSEISQTEKVENHMISHLYVG